MRNRQKSDVPPNGGSNFDPDSDNFANPFSTVRQVFQEDSFPEGSIRRLEVSFFANGDASARVFPLDSDEPVGYFYANPDSPREWPQ
jgi:hypothetical protein